MGLFDRLFGPPAVERADEELGTLRRARGKAHWTAEVPIPGIVDGKPAHVEMSGDDDGPDAMARADVRKLRKRWPKLLERAIDTLLELESNARDSDTSRPEYDRRSILDEYELRSVRLQTTGSGVDLELGFQPRSDLDHFMHVHFKDWKLAGYGVDS